MSPMTLKIYQGHRGWRERVKLDKTYHLAQFRRSNLNIIRENANVKFLKR